jgi:hypothetical protein
MMNDSILPFSDADSVPVYDCHILLSPPGPGEDSYRGVVSNLPDVAAHGPSERECLRQIVLEFKKLLQYHQAEGTPVPWLENRLEPQPGQLERWIPVHL